MNRKLTARAFLIAIVFVAALIYVVDFVNPLTPDPPGILKSLQWQMLLTVSAWLLAVNLRILIELYAALKTRLNDSNCLRIVPSPCSVLDRTCSRLI